MAIETTSHALLICRSYRPPGEGAHDFGLEGIPGRGVSVPSFPFRLELTTFVRMEFTGSGTLSFEVRLLVPGAAQPRTIFEERVPNLVATDGHGTYATAKPIRGQLDRPGLHGFELWVAGERRTAFTVFVKEEGLGGRGPLH
ncbi:MAG: hypothetical protein H6721_30765 [Sandaracinus sp.]|nr:hypothetical protein [Sandaracinus sp.]